jgi:hypothetical protein
MELVIRRDAAGSITSVDVVVARFSTFHLADVPPKDFVATVQSQANVKHYDRGGTAPLPEEELGYVRYHIQSMIHPCENTGSDIFWGTHEHASHSKCFCPNPLIFVFSNKETAMRDLRSLGCDIEKEYVRSPPIVHRDGSN